MGTLFHALMIACWVAGSDAAGSTVRSDDRSASNVSPGVVADAPADVAWRWDDTGGSISNSSDDRGTVGAEDAWNLFLPDDSVARLPQDVSKETGTDNEPALVPLPAPAILAISGLVTAFIIHRRQQRR